MGETVQAQTAAGVVTGMRQGRMCRFSAIPFAQPPVGNLRFRPPEPARWRGSLDATHPGPVAPQLPSRLSAAMGDFHSEQSEDCLHLTIWTPAPDARRRPVVVWLHGGAWMSGGGALAWYDGAALAERGDIVVVAPNYRLGALGWLHLPGEVANAGLLDQALAIAWVREHIEAFGGDPERITVMGQSAGGANIAAMLTRTSHLPPVDRIILQSASLGRGFRTAEVAAHMGALFMEAAGAAHLRELQQVPVARLLDAQRAPAIAQALAAENANRTPFGLVADGQVLAANEHGSLCDAAGRVDVLAGYTLHEMAAFTGRRGDETGARLGDAIYGEPARQWTEDARAQGRAAWLYRFDFAPTPAYGACHCLELPFVFGSFDAFEGAAMLEGVEREQAARLTSQMQAFWLAFIHKELHSPQAPQVTHFA